VLTGAGGTFSAGMDLKAFLKGETPVIGDRGMCGITMTPPRKPLIGAVEGWALAGGFELLLACDLVVAAEDAKFGVPEVKRALVAGAGAAMLLPQRVAPAIALELLLTGEPIGATRGYEIGLINKLVPSGTALEAAVAMGQQIAANGPLAVAVTKQIAKEGRHWSPEEAWSKQGRLMAPVFTSEDAREGATAFAQKRAPVWTGR
jgi:enoyl-CoA hydratase